MDSGNYPAATAAADDEQSFEDVIAGIITNESLSLESKCVSISCDHNFSLLCRRFFALLSSPRFFPLVSQSQVHQLVGWGGMQH